MVNKKFLPNAPFHSQFPLKCISAFLVLSIGTMVGLYSTMQVMEKIWQVHGMLESHRKDFAEVEQHFQ